MNITQAQLISYLQGSLSDEMKISVEQWIDKDQNNKAYFDSLKLVWESEWPEEPRTFDQKSAWRKINQAIDSHDSRKGATYWWRVAAAVLFTVGLGFISYYLTRTSSDLHLRVVRAVDEHQEVVLPDGSLVALRAGSQISFPESFENRNINLDGEGFFQVVSLNQKPFKVNSDHATIEVVGTEFLVRESGSVDLISVNEGLVRVSSSNNGPDVLELERGKAVQVDKSGRMSTQAPSANQMSWVSDELRFNNTDFRQVLNDIAEHYGVEFYRIPKRLQTCKVTSKFKSKSLEDVLEVLELILNIEIKQTLDNRYTVSGNGC